MVSKFNKKSYLFACGTEYTMINCLNLCLNEIKRDSTFFDIAIFERTKKIRLLSDSLRESGVFRNVYNYIFINRLNTIILICLFLAPIPMLNYFFALNNLKKIKKNSYDVIISQNLIYALLFLRLNKKAQVYLIEEGLSSYTGRTSNSASRSFLFKLVFRLFFGRKFSDLISQQYFYNPDLNLSDTKSISEIPQFPASNHKLLNKFFKYSHNHIYDESTVVYLGAPLFGLKDLLLDRNPPNLEIEKLAKTIISKMLNYPNKKKLIYRKHPLESVENIDGVHHYDFDIVDNVWELECLNSITEKHIIISFFSTGAFSPKLLFGKEPTVVFLYQLLNKEFKNADELVDKFRKQYSEPSKVIQIKSLNELHAFLHIK